MTDNYVVKPKVTALSIQSSSQTFPVHRVYCVGQNYAAHAIEMGSNPDRETPFFFSKPADTVHQQAVMDFPGATNNLHHEVELVVALHSGGSQLNPEEVDEHIFGYGVGVDLTRRDLQANAKAKGRPWDVAKGFDNAGPISRLVPKTEWQLEVDAEIALFVNNDLKQQAILRQLIWSVPELIAELSKYYELQGGDLIFTGTPAGVGVLQPGDEVRASISGLPDCQFKLS